MIIERPESNKLLGLYRGEVVQHLPHGKLKVFIPSVYSDEWKSTPDMLPEAEQLAPLFGGSNQGNGIFSYPNIGSIVMCQFINGDQNYPLVVGATLGGPYAYGQYTHVYKNVMKGTSVLSTDISSVNHSSPAHLITVGKTQVKLFEDGRLSAITSTPTNVPVSVNFETQKVSDFQKPNINSQFVMANAGEISVSTNDYMNKIHSICRTNISGNINLLTYSPEVSCCINMDSQGVLTLDTREKDSSTKIIVKSNGVVVIDSASQIQIHSDSINISADKQLDINSSYCNINCPTLFNVNSQKIQLNSISGVGITEIKAKNSSKVFK